MAKKKRKPMMKFYTLRLNDRDIDHLRWILQMDVEMHQHCMDNPSPEKQTPEEKLEDWVVSRDLMADSMKVIQMIDRIYKPRRK